MPVYEVKAVGHDRTVVVIGTTDTATAALIKFRDALASYRRAWVSDDSGADVSQEDVIVTVREHHGPDSSIHSH